MNQFHQILQDQRQMDWEVCIKSIKIFYIIQKASREKYILSIFLNHYSFFQRIKFTTESLKKIHIFISETLNIIYSLNQISCMKSFWMKTEFNLMMFKKIFLKLFVQFLVSKLTKEVIDILMKDIFKIYYHKLISIKTNNLYWLIN